MRRLPVALAFVLGGCAATPVTTPAPVTTPSAPSLSNAPAPSVTSAPTPIPTAQPFAVAPPPGAISARVTRVVDGDTVVIEGISVGRPDRSTPGRYARLIGVDTPEVYGGVECYGREASAFTKRALDHRRVRVTFDLDRTDRYNRALVYVWQDDGVFFNARLVAEGYALQLTVPPNVRYVDLFRNLVTQAREANRGLWRGCG
jgi:micrococcal nuclease